MKTYLSVLSRVPLGFPRGPSLPDCAYSASAGDAEPPTFFAQSRSFDRITWAGRHYPLRVLQHHYGLFWK